MHAADIIAGIAAIEALQQFSMVPSKPSTVMAIRAEETGNFHI